MTDSAEENGNGRTCSETNRVLGQVLFTLTFIVLNALHENHRRSLKDAAGFRL